MIGFDINELNEIDWYWIEYSLRENLQVLEGLEKEPSPELAKVIKEVKNALRKVEVKRKTYEQKG
jgi:hypothetical protein